MRFSIRDLLWTTLVVAMGLGWWVSYTAVDARRIEAAQLAQRQRTALLGVKGWIREMMDRSPYDVKWLPIPVDKRIWDEPPAEP
jgi:hypothetical protein